MCGVVGFVDQRMQCSLEESVSTISTMASKLMHRGPDDSGVWVEPKVGLALGHRRLSVIDLSPTGHQPMISSDGRYVIVYNGEVYNYQEIRVLLVSLGHSFTGTSDTEVVLSAFSHWGVETSLKLFVGMFAFALWDCKDHLLYLGRDRIGEKPLYYGWNGSVFLFGSELKSITAHPQWQGKIDLNSLALYFKYNFVPSPYSIYKGIFKLPAGTFLTLDLDNIIPSVIPEPQQYWSLCSAAEKGVSDQFNGDDQEAVSELSRILQTAVARQMFADVPTGAFFSGGIDSSCVVALMQAQSHRPVKTFTIGSRDDALNEAKYAKEIASHLGTEHTEIYIEPKQALEVIQKLPVLYDEPFADSSQIPAFLVARCARQHVTVSLTGDGGDEVFCGYNRHVLLNSVWHATRWQPKFTREFISYILRSIPVPWLEYTLRQRNTGIHAEQIQKLASIITLKSPEEMYLKLRCFWDYPPVLNQHHSKEYSALLSESIEQPNLPHFIERLLCLESLTSLPDDMLVKVDRAAMANSLETRLPFLDHRVIEFAWRLPISMKIRNGVGKWILRQILHQFVPSKLLKRPKAGFSIPIDIWLKGVLKDWAEDLLSEERIRNEGFLDPIPIRNKWETHISGKSKWQWHIWSVLMFEAWLQSQEKKLYV